MAGLVFNVSAANGCYTCTDLQMVVGITSTCYPDHNGSFMLTQITFCLNHFGPRNNNTHSPVCSHSPTVPQGLVNSFQSKTVRATSNPRADMVGDPTFSTIKLLSLKLRFIVPLITMELGQSRRKRSNTAVRFMQTGWFGGVIF